MNELSLFSGAGGGLLATKHFLNWRTVGYVEFNNYCQQILAQRIEDGFLDEAPIFGSIDSFIESGAAKKYRGVVEVLSAGFPCQPFSGAGKQKGKEDDRNKWPQTIQCVRDIRPRYVFLENVPGLLTSGYFGEILTTLAEAGYDARWTVLGAADVGAPHRRNRLWILAKSQHPDTYSIGSHRAEKHQHGSSESNDEQIGESGSVREVLAHTESEQRNGGNDDSRVSLEGQQIPQSGDSGGEKPLAYADTGHRIEPQEQIQTGRATPDNSGEYVAHSVSDSEGSAHGSKVWRGFEGWEDEDIKEWYEVGGNPTNFSGQWAIEPNVGRVAHGVASRVDRLKALGNGQVPLVADVAWGMLGGQELEEI